MRILTGPSVLRILAGIALISGTVPRTATGQETADSIDLDGEWEFDYEVVRVTHEGTAVRAEFVEGAECFDGQVRPYFLDGVLSGTSLTGSMMVCSRSPRLVEECGISSMYETTFEATVDPGRIAGTRVAQGLATEEEGGRYVSCVPDSRYDGVYDFAGTRSCAEAEREVEELWARLEAMVEESNAIADQLANLPPVGNWTVDGYTGPQADLAERWRAIQEELVTLVEQLNATQDPAEAAALQTRLEALVAESNSIEDVFFQMNATNWMEDDYVGPEAELAARWRALDAESMELLRRLQEAEARVAECRTGRECPAPPEDLWARLEAMVEESNAIADQLANLPPIGNWTVDGYTGPNADQAERWRAIQEEMVPLVERLNATQDPAEAAALQARLDALVAESNSLEDVLSMMNATNWMQDDYIGPEAELAARWRALDSESMEVLRQLQEAEARRRECAEAVG